MDTGEMNVSLEGGVLFKESCQSDYLRAGISRQCPPLQYPTRLALASPFVKE